MVEARARCGDLRTRWEQAKGQRIFYERAMMAFVVMFLVFLVALVYQLVANVSGTDARITSIAGLVGSGGVGGWFWTLRQSAQSDEDKRYTKYDKACPLPDSKAAATDALGAAARQELEDDQ